MCSQHISDNHPEESGDLLHVKALYAARLVVVDRIPPRCDPSEKTISMIKDKGALKAGWCRSFGLAAHTIGALALAIAHNLKQTITVERTQTDKPTAPARPKNFQPTRRNVSANTAVPRAPSG